MNWPVILMMNARLEEQKKASLEKKKQWKFQSKSPHPQPSGNDSETSGFLPAAVKSLPNPLSTGQRHNFPGYEGRPQFYPVRKGSCPPVGYMVTGGMSVSRSKTSDY